MKRTTVRLEVEVEGPTVSGESIRNWFLEMPEESSHHEDARRIVRIDVLGEDR